jgi:hypothetical protein
MGFLNTSRFPPIVVNQKGEVHDVFLIYLIVVNQKIDRSVIPFVFILLL